MTQPPDDLGISDGDLEDLTDVADEILRHVDRTYIINHRISGIEAVEWVDAYNKAVDGDVDGVLLMMNFLHTFADRLLEMMEVPDELIGEYNAESLGWSTDDDDEDDV